MTTLIVPACGRSARYGNGKPKWQRTDPSGELMLVKAIEGITGYDKLIVGLVKEHIDTHRLNMDVLKNKLTRDGIVPEFVVLDTFTSSQSETVYRLVDGVDGAFFVKDCDNYFEYVVCGGNVVCTSKLASDTNATNKSYVSLDKMGKLAGMVEKQVIGDQFCCGGYGFASSKQFREVYEKVNGVGSIDSGELYISHIIQDMLLNGNEFDVIGVNGYLDWGDKNVWRKYCGEYKTIFCDVDGVLLNNASEYFEPQWGQSKALPNNIAVINAMFDSGKVKVILTTSRKSSFAEATEKQMKEVGLKYHSIIYDLFHSQRMIINDFSNSNPFPSAVAVNVERDGDDLDAYLGIDITNK